MSPPKSALLKIKTHMINKYPIARNSDVVVQELSEEVLVYDLNTHQARCLNKVSALIWQNCDGTKSPAEIAAILESRLKTPVGEATVRFAIYALAANNLMKDSIEAPSDGMTRRDLVKTLGASAAVALPVIFAVVAPEAAQAASNTSCVQMGGTCNSVAQCCTGLGFCLVCDPGTNTCLDGCVTYDAPVLTADGRYVAARDVFVGQSLAGVDTSDGSAAAGEVIKIKGSLSQSIYSLTTTTGHTLQCSPGHLFVPDLGADGKSISRYRVGDSLLIYSEESKGAVKSEIAALEHFKIQQSVLTFKIKTPNSTYISGGIVSNG